MKEKRHRICKDIRRDWQLYVFLVIPVLLVFVFSYIPMGGLIMAFEDYKVRKGILGSEWVGLENFKKFFGSYNAWQIIENTLVLSVYGLLASFPFSIIFA